MNDSVGRKVGMEGHIPPGLSHMGGLVGRCSVYKQSQGNRRGAFSNPKFMPLLFHVEGGLAMLLKTFRLPGRSGPGRVLFTRKC